MREHVGNVRVARVPERIYHTETPVPTWRSGNADGRYEHTRFIWTKPPPLPPPSPAPQPKYASDNERRVAELEAWLGKLEARWAMPDAHLCRYIRREIAKARG